MTNGTSVCVLVGSATIFMWSRVVTGETGLPEVPGFEVDVYAVLCTPVGISVGNTGTLFAGNGGCGGGSSAPAWVRRIGPGGVVQNYGESTIRDPDAVVFDSAGVISGVAGSVLVGGIPLVTAILPDETIMPVFTGSGNPSNMEFDGDGRLLILLLGGSVLVSTGEPPVELFTIQGGAARGLAIDSSNRIYTTAADGVIRIHNPDGTIFDDDFASGLGKESSLAFGLGGVFGTQLYAMTFDGRLLRYSDSGDVTIVGTGFTGRPAGMDFDEDDVLYVSLEEAEQILRIAPLCVGDVNDDGTVDFTDILILLAFWGECRKECTGDIDGDGDVDFADLLLLLAAWGPCE